MKRYSKLQPTKKTPVTTRDRKGNPSSITIADKSFKFDKASKKWILRVKKKVKSKNCATRTKLIAKATRSELVFRSLLRSLAIPHEFQAHIKTDVQNRYADFSVPHLKLIIEIDGGYHNDPAQQMKDTEREKEIKKSTGYEIIRFTNEQVEKEPEVLFNALVGALRKKFDSLKCHWDTFYK